VDNFVQKMENFCGPARLWPRFPHLSTPRAQHFHCFYTKLTAKESTPFAIGRNLYNRQYWRGYQLFLRAMMADLFSTTLIITAILSKVLG
jgi:hypothetical protein